MTAARVKIDAAKLRVEIAAAKKEVRTLTAQIRHREGRLRRVAADAFNDATEASGEVLAEVREVLLGSRACARSPVEVCCYSRLGRLISIPGQLRKGDAWDEARRHHAEHPERVGETWTPACTDACLFCGKQRGKTEVVS